MEGQRPLEEGVSLRRSWAKGEKMLASIASRYGAASVGAFKDWAKDDGPIVGKAPDDVVQGLTGLQADLRDLAHEYEREMASLDRPTEGFGEWLTDAVGTTAPMVGASIVAMAAGGVPAAGSLAYVMGVGEVDAAMEQAGVGPDSVVTMGPWQIPASAITTATGIPMAAIELAGGPELIMRKVLGGASREAGQGVLASVLKNSILSGATEASEEVAQNYVANIAANVTAGKPLDAEFWKSTGVQGLKEGATILPLALATGGLGGAALPGQMARPQMPAVTDPAYGAAIDALSSPSGADAWWSDSPVIDPSLPAYGGQPAANFQEPAAPGYGPVTGAPTAPPVPGLGESPVNLRAFPVLGTPQTPTRVSESPRAAEGIDQTDQGEQIVIPGAERGIGPTAPPQAPPSQAPMPSGGLFDEGARAQGDLVDAIGKAEPKPKGPFEAGFAAARKGKPAAPPKLGGTLYGDGYAKAQQYAAELDTIDSIRRPPTITGSGTLTGWLVSQGGLREESGELKHSGITSRTRPGLVNNRTGKTFDDAGLAAYEAGFFPERPTVAQFLDALAGDFNKTTPRYHPDMESVAAEIDTLGQFAAEFESLGINVNAPPAVLVQQLDAAFAGQGMATAAEMRDMRPELLRNRIQTYRQTSASKAGGPGERHVPVYSAERGGVVPRDQQPPKPPITREEIVRDFSKALRIPIYEGRIKGRKTLGFYRKGVDEVRIKKGATDLEVTAHELAHYLDMKLDPSIRQKLWARPSNANKVYRDELRAVSYDKNKLHEGWAEAVRLWLSQHDRAKEVAPRLTAWLDDYFAGDKPHHVAFRQAQKDMHAWFAQDPATRMGSKIDPQEVAEATLNTVVERFRQNITDDLQGLHSAEKLLFGDIKPVGIYETARLTRAKYSIVDGAFQYGPPVVQPDGSHRFEGKGLMEILKPVGHDLDGWIKYMVARRARLLKDQGRERLFTSAEIKAGLALETPAFKKAAEEWREFNNSILDFAEAKGVLDPAKRRRWQTDVYIPFYRVGQKGPKAKGKDGTPGDWAGIKRLTGGTGALKDVLGNMIQNTAMLIDAALTNEVMVKAKELARKDGGARFLAKISPADVKALIPTQEVERVFWEAMDVPQAQVRLMRQGMIPEGAEWLVEIMDAFDRQDGLMEFWLHNQKPRGDNIVVALKGGKPTYYEVADPLFLRSLQSMHRPPKGLVMQMFNTVRRVSQASVTFSFDFLVKNIARDTLMGSIFSKHGFRPVMDSIIGLKSRWTEDENYREAIANGMGISSYLMDESAFKADLGRLYKPTNVLHPRNLLLLAERIADSFEMSTRLGEYRRAKQTGAHPRHAAYEGREVSTDFAMRGDDPSASVLFDSILFLKAGINGLDRGYRGFAWDVNRGQIARRTAILALLSMALYVHNRSLGDDEFDDMEDWERDSYWHFRVGGKWWKYPKIWEIGAVASWAERAMEAGMNGDDKDLYGHLGTILLNMFNLGVIPQAIQPAVEVYGFNRDTFTERPIETTAMQNMEPWRRAGPYTSRTLKAIGEATKDLPPKYQVSPAKAEALLRGYFNTWSLYGLSLADGVFFDDAPDIRLDQYPIVRSFHRGPGRSTKYVTQFYDLVEEMTQARATARDVAKEAELGTESRRELAEKLTGRTEVGLAPAMAKAQRTMSSIRTTMAAVSEAGDIKHLRDKVAKPWRQQRAGIYQQLGIKVPPFPTRTGTDIGALKRALLDDMARVRNAFAKRTVQTFEAERAKR